MIAADSRWQDLLVAKAACDESVAFAQGFNSFQAAWDACERGDWMLWWIGRTMRGGPMSAERRPLVRVGCACARLALPYVRAGEDRPRLAIEIAERWANGDDTVTREQLRASAYAAADARHKVWKQCADLVRQEYPTPPLGSIACAVERGAQG